MAVRTMNPVHVAGTCAVAATAEIIGAKWTALLVHDLSEGPRRFSELERSCLGISPRTAETHRVNIGRRLGIRNVAQMVRYAIENKL